MTPQQETDEYLLLVGQGLQAWSQVENNMFNLFMQVAGTDDRRSILIYDAIVSFDARLDVLHRLMLCDLQDEQDRAVWTKLYKKIRKFYQKRHELAHFDIRCSHTGREEGGTDITVTFHPLFTMGKAFGRSEKPLRTLKAADIRLRITRFKEIASAIQYFWAESLRRRHEPSSNSTPVPKLIQELRAT